MKMGCILYYVVFLFFILFFYVLCMFCVNLKMKLIGWNLEILCDEKMFFLVVVGLYLLFLINNKYYGYGVEKLKW